MLINTIVSASLLRLGLFFNALFFLVTYAHHNTQQFVIKVDSHAHVVIIIIIIIIMKRSFMGCKDNSFKSTVCGSKILDTSSSLSRLYPMLSALQTLDTP